VPPIELPFRVRPQGQQQGETLPVRACLQRRDPFSLHGVEVLSPEREFFPLIANCPEVRVDLLGQRGACS
jgi:hypothetical protein